ncbi:heparinase II/III family protein, partial [candidate division KSB1 bacterium]|nr:heparinase II/III family protein [candidate division KSB1 bacterium]
TRLAQTFPPEKLAELLPAHHQWRPFPTIDERQKWHVRVPAAILDAHMQLGEKNLNAEWPDLPATLMLEFTRTGNRSNFQERSFTRRAMLAHLVLAEVLEGEGRFLDDIANGIWAICEETYWGVPAHLNMQAEGYGLPDVSEPIVDLFAAETGALLAWTDYLLNAHLDNVSPLLRKRIAQELDRRIITPILVRDDFWWMGLADDFVNNWNPWINSNYLTIVLLQEPDPQRRAAAVHKALLTLDRFVQSYPADGGCDEGPTYWGRAAASLFDCLELLYNASDGVIDVFADPLVRNMARFITHTHIDGNYFINFADAAPRSQPDPSLVYRYGKAIKDPHMMAFAAYLAQRQNYGDGALPGNFGYLPRLLPALMTFVELKAQKPAAPHQRDLWLPDIQVMAARSRAGSIDGFYLAAKGGHNDESHNHNDIGSFIVYQDGLPLLIDVGVGTYTKQTFSPDRYKIWTMQSGFHNLPTINGVMQMQGRRYAARDVHYRVDDETAELTLDIAGAYPDSAMVQSWKRCIRLHRGQEIELTERYVLNEWRQPVVVNLMTSRVATEIKPGILRLDTEPLANDARSTASAELHFPADRFFWRAELIMLDDPALQQSWGDRVYRLIFESKDKNRQGDFTFRLR